MLVKGGATVLFSEVTEVRDAIHLLTPRAVNEEVGKRLLEEMEEEEDISADDVESTFTGNPPGGLSEEEKAELMSDYVSEVDEDFSTGMTYEDMMNAVGVLTEENRNMNDEKVIRTVKSIYDIRQTEIFDFFTTEVSNIELVESLFKECLDEYGEPLPQRKKEAPPESEEKFDWDKYV